MSLPAWVIEVSKESGTSRIDYTARLVQALLIAWDVLESIQALESDGSSAMEVCQGEAEDAIRQIEELGK
jgi:hypothetical protein